jgi:hypothetical protein
MRMKEPFSAPGDLSGQRQMMYPHQTPDNRIEPGASGDYITNIVRTITHVKGYLWPRLAVHGVRPGKKSRDLLQERRLSNMHGWKVFIGSCICLTHMRIRRGERMIQNPVRIFLSSCHTRHVSKGVH